MNKPEKKIGRRHDSEFHPANDRKSQRTVDLCLDEYTVSGVIIGDHKGKNIIFNTNS